MYITFGSRKSFFFQTTRDVTELISLTHRVERVRRTLVLFNRQLFSPRVLVEINVIKLIVIYQMTETAMKEYINYRYS